MLGGLVVNERPRVSHAQVDELKAVLHNCVKHGPSSHNRGGVVDLRAQLMDGWRGWSSTTPAGAPAFVLSSRR